MPPADPQDLIDPSRCPLCGRPNQCAMETARAAGTTPGACWCTQMDFSADLLAQVPLAARQQACICADCARRGGPPVAARGPA